MRVQTLFQLSEAQDDRRQPFTKDGIQPDLIINPIKTWLDIIDHGVWFLPSDTRPAMRRMGLGCINRALREKSVVSSVMGSSSLTSVNTPL